MIRASIRLEGVDDVLRRVERMGRQIEADVQRVIATYAVKIERLAKEAAPVDTGFLRANIHTAIGRLAADVISGADYSVFVENGTRYMAAQPFLFPAFESVRADLYRDLRAAARAV